MNIRPLGKKVIVGQLKQDNTTESGIIMTSGNPRPDNKGQVVACGPDCEFVKVGDFVVPDWNKAEPADVNGIHCGIVQEDDILLIYED